LWNTTDFNELDLECNLNSYKDNKITSDALEKTLKVTKNCKSSGEDNIKSELYKYAPV